MDHHYVIVSVSLVLYQELMSGAHKLLVVPILGFAIIQIQIFIGQLKLPIPIPGAYERRSHEGASNAVLPAVPRLSNYCLINYL